MEDGFLSTMAGNLSMGNWFEVAQFVQSLFSSEHEEHYNKGVERLNQIDFDNIEDADIIYSRSS